MVRRSLSGEDRRPALVAKAIGRARPGDKGLTCCNCQPNWLRA